MGYREQPLPPPKRQIIVGGAPYDLDSFGMDDGRAEAPDAAFRFLFQLGSGLMIYLYVIQAGGQSRPYGFHHTFWLSDCAAVEVEREEWGPPSQVACERCELPVLYPALRLGPGGPAFRVEGQAFTAPDAASLRMDFALSGGARLQWTRQEGWRVATEAGAPLRPLAPGERLLFGEPDATSATGLG